MVYNALVRPHIEYGIITWGGRKNGKLQKIKFLHNIFFFEADWSEGFEPILGTAILSTNQPVKSFSLKTLIFFVQ